MVDEASPLPALPAKSSPLDRQSVERVLARAAELQGGTTGDEASDLITENQLLEIGKEVGLAPATINQALAEERTRVHLPEERGLLSQIAGGAFATATRTVNGSQRATLVELDQWMTRQECLVVQRRFADRVTWEPQRGLIGNIRRLVNLSGRSFHLTRASQISATVLPVDEIRVVVRLDADMTATRKARLELGAATGGVGVLAAAGLGFALTIANIPFLLVAGLGAIPMILGGASGYYVVGTHRSFLASAQLALEQILDRLENRELTRTDSLLSALVPGRLLRR
jgi:hypothetical protein